MSEDEKRPDGHCSDDTTWSHFHDDYAKKTRADLALGKRSDFDVANAVFMANRNDVKLVSYMIAANERIRWLSIKLADSVVRERELVEALEQMRPLINTIKNAANINDEWGRVVIGQADAARKLYDLHSSTLKGDE